MGEETETRIVRLKRRWNMAYCEKCYVFFGGIVGTATLRCPKCLIDELISDRRYEAESE